MSRMLINELEFGPVLKLPKKEYYGTFGRDLKGCYMSLFFGEAVFVPPKSFLNKHPLWRIDVLQDLMHDFELVRRMALVEWAAHYAELHPMADPASQNRAFRSMCKSDGLHVPDDFESLLIPENGYIVNS